MIDWKEKKTKEKKRKKEGKKPRACFSGIGGTIIPGYFVVSLRYKYSKFENLLVTDI